MKTITVNISDLAYKQLKDAAERDRTTLANFARPAIEKAAYAASLAKFAAPDGGPPQYDPEYMAKYQADVDRVIYGDNDLCGQARFATGSIPINWGRSS